MATLPAVCGAATISHGTLTAWRCWGMFRGPKHFLPDLRDCLTDNPAVVSDINHQGGLNSRPLYKLAHQILVWSQDRFLSLRAIYIPWYLNVGADVLSRQRLRPREWMVYPRWRSRYGECLVWLRWTFL